MAPAPAPGPTLYGTSDQRIAEGCCCAPSSLLLAPGIKHLAAGIEHRDQSLQLIKKKETKTLFLHNKEFFPAFPIEDITFWP